LTTYETGDQLAAVEEIYREIKQVQRELRPADRIVRDLAIDSLAALELLVALEERFGVELVGDPRAAGLETVADLLDLLADARTPARSRIEGR
jgi:acyl carrier protein